MQGQREVRTTAGDTPELGASPEGLMEPTDLSVVGDAQLEAQLTATAQEIGLRTARKKKLENARALAEARATDLAAATEAAASRSPQPPPETRPTTKVGASPGGDGAKATAQANEPEPEHDLSDEIPPRSRDASQERIQAAAERAADHFIDGAAVHVYQDQGPLTWQSAADVSNCGELVQKFLERRESMKDFDASQRCDFDHLMAPTEVVGEADGVDDAEMPVAALSNEELVVINAYTAMELTFEKWVNGYV